MPDIDELASRGREPGELADALLESRGTIRRDLKRLEESGLVAVEEAGVFRLTEAVAPIQRAAPTLFPASTFPDGDLD